MEEEWLNDKLCSLNGDKARVEKGPQIIELFASKGNLCNRVTSARYQEGAIDAHGNVIGTKNKMHVVDNREIFVPHLWKVYELQDKIFINVYEDEDKNKALAFARGLKECHI